jgi:hypothetical protein
MALNFPNSPAINQRYSAEGVTFVWDGAQWLVTWPWATQAEALAGTRTDVALSPLTTEQAIVARNFQTGVMGGTPVNVAAQRVIGTNYQNTGTRSRMVQVNFSGDIGGQVRIGPTGTLADQLIAVLLGASGRNNRGASFAVPPGWFYRINGVGASIANWWEW